MSSIQCRFCQSCGEIKAVGDYCIDRSRPNHPMFIIWLPRDSNPSRLRLYQVTKTIDKDGKEVVCGDSSHWVLTGSDEKPTLSPSINHPGVWHGHLENGILKEC